MPRIRVSWCRKSAPTATLTASNDERSSAPNHHIPFPNSAAKMKMEEPADTEVPGPHSRLRRSPVKIKHSPSPELLPPPSKTSPAEKSRRHRALCRLLHARGWSIAEITRHTSMSGGTISRAVKNVHDTGRVVNGARVYEQNRDDEAADGQLVDGEKLAELIELEQGLGIGVPVECESDSNSDSDSEPPLAMAVVGRQPAARSQSFSPRIVEEDLDTTPTPNSSETRQRQRRALCRILHKRGWPKSDISKKAKIPPATIFDAIRNVLRTRSGIQSPRDDEALDEQVVDDEILQRMLGLESSIDKLNTTSQTSSSRPKLGPPGRRMDQSNTLTTGRPRLAKFPKLELAERALCRILRDEHHWKLNEIAFALGRPRLGGRSPIFNAVHNRPRRESGQEVTDDPSKDYDYVDRRLLAKLVDEASRNSAGKQRASTSREVFVEIPKRRPTESTSRAGAGPQRTPRRSAAETPHPYSRGPSARFPSIRAPIPQACVGASTEERYDSRVSVPNLRDFLANVKPTIDLSPLEEIFVARGLRTVQHLKDMNSWKEDDVEKALRRLFGAGCAPGKHEQTKTLLLSTLIFANNPLSTRWISLPIITRTRKRRTPASRRTRTTSAGRRFRPWRRLLTKKAPGPPVNLELEKSCDAAFAAEAIKYNCYGLLGCNFSHAPAEPSQNCRSEISDSQSPQSGPEENSNHQVDGESAIARTPSETKPTSIERKAQKSKYPKLTLPERALCRILYKEYNWVYNAIADALGRPRPGGESPICRAVRNAPRRENRRWVTDDVSKDHDVVDKVLLNKLVNGSNGKNDCAASRARIGRATSSGPSRRGNHPVQGSADSESKYNPTQITPSNKSHAPRTSATSTPTSGRETSLRRFLLRAGVSRKHEALLLNRGIESTGDLKKMRGWPQKEVEDQMKDWFQDDLTDYEVALLRHAICAL
uniref:C3H1-type domain-containing protein n=1 Tax=Mycena chlorophos TaxID=658473 RepID=A0ABQ0L0Y5_MYCCL|nr:predicted protein [Mycena chlorophos]